MNLNTNSNSLGTIVLTLAVIAVMPPISSRGQSPSREQTRSTGSSPIVRRLPPHGIELSAETVASLKAELGRLQSELAAVSHPLRADAAVLLKAVDYALRHGEFYAAKDAQTAAATLALAAARLDQLRAGTAPWDRQTGLVVRGFRSRIDDSPQPYGLVIPAEHDFDQPCPLYVWLHGRGDSQTDLHFIQRLRTNAGQIQPPGAIVVHPFGRHCLGFKSAGEADVLEAIEHVQRQYRIDPDRIVLMGFSMGGAGAWHVGAHHADRFVAVSPGAGFAETAQYNKLTAEQFPPWYEQRLWGAYDTPCYTLNLFNLPVVAYSGELDKQIQAARVMEAAFRAEGRELPHLIGPGMGHKYHPDTLAELLRRMEAAVRPGRPARPDEVHLQTRTLRYHRQHWVAVLRLVEHWRDTRVVARIVGDGVVEVRTTNVTRLELSPFPDLRGVEIRIDGATLVVPREAGSPHPSVVLARAAAVGHEKWQVEPVLPAAADLAKRPGLQGPIDDVFLEPFLVVTPSRPAGHPRVQQWVEQELAHFLDRWRATFRGEARVKTDDQVTEDDLAQYHLVIWGDPASNRFARQAVAADQGAPIAWSSAAVRVGDQSFDAASHVPAFIFPHGERYWLLNSGPTFREAHDRTNSLQNPKLPDWAVFDLSQPPNDQAAGRIAAAGFFDEQWRWKPPEVATSPPK